ncbi:MAG: 5'/3'-nucleotidase SurE, partial [Ardenticatenaceae bacterium]
MRILATNDDGVNSPGLWSVVGALNDVGEVIVVAPDRDQSGIGTAKTLLAVVRANEFAAPIAGIRAYTV